MIDEKERDELQKKYFSIKSDIARFRLTEDFETKKTVAAIDAIADRADFLRRGCEPGVYRGGAYSCPPGIKAKPFLEKARFYTDELLAGRYPLRGKLCEPGHSFVDHSFIVRDGVLHVFYNRGTVGYDWAEIPHDTIGHAWTRDLTHWEFAHPAVSALPGTCMEYQVWSPAVIERGGRYYMFYTGVNYNIAQSTCLAFSDDLFEWKVCGNNPVYIPEAEWCPWDYSHWSDCRDHFVVRDGDDYYMYFCTSRYTADRTSVEPASGIAHSRDLIHWETVGTFRLPGCSHAAESPFVLRHGDMWYFFYTNVGVGTSYAISDNPVSGWKEIGPIMDVASRPADTSWVPSCAEVFEFNGKWYVSHCTRMDTWEQYLELNEFIWNGDGSVSVGSAVL